MRRPVYHRTRRRVVARLLVAAVLACAPSILFAQRNDQREQPEVRDLRLNGVHQVNPRDLLRSIATSESRCKKPVVGAVLLHQPLVHDLGSQAVR